MAGNTFGEVFKVTTYGESHGPAIGCVIDGVPPNIELKESDIQHDLDRRRPGQSKITTQRKEDDKVQILSGVFEGKTTGTSLSLIIHNQDQRSKDYSNIKDIFRPGHADYTFEAKYGIRDYRGGGRSSGRETATRVAAGAVAKKILDKLDIKIVAFTRAVGSIYADNIDYAEIEKNPVRTADKEAAERMIEAIDEARKNLDSLGGIVEAVVVGCPAGLGDPVFGKLNAKLAYGLMSIGTARGIEFGTGFEATEMTGSEHNDKFYADGSNVRTTTNHAGGMLGGISTGENITLRLAIKPPSSIAQKQQSITKDLKNATVEVKGRHDPCICPRVVPVVESMIALTLVDCLMLQKMIS